MKKLCENIIAAAIAMSALFSSACAAADNPGDISDIDIGESVSFGHYETDGVYSNGKEALEWTALDITDDGRALLLCDCCIDALPYDSDGENVTWADSEIREWLNDEFIDTAFVGDEEKLICCVTNNNPDGRSKTEGGDDTEDRVFLLSINEVEKYLPNEIARRAVTTEYAKLQGAEYDTYGNGRWWLRSPGKTQDTAAGVHVGGGINYDGRKVDIENSCIRPAMWIRIDGEAEESAVSGAEEFKMPLSDFIALYGDPMSGADGFKRICETEDGVLIYGNTVIEGRGNEEYFGDYIYVIHDDMAQRFKCRWLAHYDQEAVWEDIDGDLEDELVFNSDVLTGTGTHEDELAVFEIEDDGSYSCSVLTLEEMEKQLREFLDVSVSGDEITLTVTEGKKKVQVTVNASAEPTCYSPYNRFCKRNDGKGYYVLSTAMLYKDNGEYDYRDYYLAMHDDADFDPFEDHVPAEYLDAAAIITADIKYSDGKFTLKNIDLN